MTVVLRPAGRGNWKTTMAVKFSGPCAPGALAYRIGQCIEFPIGFGLTALWRVVEIRA